VYQGGISDSEPASGNLLPLDETSIFGFDHSVDYSSNIVLPAFSKIVAEKFAPHGIPTLLVQSLRDSFRVKAVRMPALNISFELM